MTNKQLSPQAKQVLLTSINAMIKELDQEQWIRDMKRAEAAAKLPGSPEQREFAIDNARQDNLFTRG